MNNTLLRKLMRQRKITQEQMADRLGIDRSTFSRKINTETGKGFCLREASEIGHALGLTPVQMADVFFVL